MSDPASLSLSYQNASVPAYQAQPLEVAEMIPTLLDLGWLRIPTHEFFVGLGLAVGAVIFTLEARRRGTWDERFYPIFAGILFGGAIGERLGGGISVAASGEANMVDAWLYGGRSILGGLAGAYVGALIAKRLVGYEHSTGDLFAPAVAMGLAIGRIGCFLTEAPGRPSNLPWAIRVPAGMDIPQCPGCDAGLSMHPSIAYEIIFLVAAYAWLRLNRDSLARPGDLFVTFIETYAVFRFTVEFTRANPPAWAGLTGSQIFLLSMSPLIAAKALRVRRRQSAPVETVPARTPGGSQ